MGAEPASTWAYKYAPEAQGERRALPNAVLQVLLDVVDELARDPGAFADRVRPYTPDGALCLYVHPPPTSLEITFRRDHERRELTVLHIAGPAFRLSTPIFVCYSHRDAEWLDQLKVLLEPLVGQGVVKAFDDTQIRPGREWLDEILSALESARVGILLVSEHFLASRFIQRVELPALLEGASRRGVTMFWIALGPRDISKRVKRRAFYRYQAAIDPSRPLATVPKEQREHLLREVYAKIERTVADAGQG